LKYVRDLTLQPYNYEAQADTKYIPTGFSSDYLTDDLMSRKISIITGQSEEGKSVVVHRIMLNAIDKGFKVLLVDGEYYQEELIRELYLKIIGNDRSLYDVRRPNKTDIKEPKRHILTLMQKWHKDKIYIISKNNCDCDFDNFENLFNVMVEAIQLYHIDLVILDNMASLVSSSQAERNSVQADFIKNVIQIDQKYNCHSLIVNHPKKQNER